MQAGHNQRQQQQASTNMLFRGAVFSKFAIGFSVVSYIYMSHKGISLPLDSSNTTATGYLTSKIAFSSPGEALVGTSLLTMLLRKYEREMGTRKFVVFWSVVQALSIAQEFLVVQLLSARNLVYTDSARPIRFVYAGPYALLAALFYLYHRHGPRIHPRFVSVFGLHFSEKTFYYVWYAQLILSGGWNVLLPTTVGTVASILYTRSPIRHWRVPDAVLQRMEPILRYISPPAAVAPNRMPMPPPRLPPQRMQQQERQPPPEAEIPVPEPDDEAIEQLTNMGFPRPQVMEALRQTHNNVEHAANRLLGGT